jgi:hypothetical protein
LPRGLSIKPSHGRHGSPLSRLQMGEREVVSVNSR